jgi:hypothetical protein
VVAEHAGEERREREHTRGLIAPAPGVTYTKVSFEGLFWHWWILFIIINRGKVSFDTDEYYSSLSTEASYREKRPCKRDIQKVTNRGKRDLLPEAQ